MGVESVIVAWVLSHADTLDVTCHRQIISQPVNEVICSSLFCQLYFVILLQ